MKGGRILFFSGVLVCLTTSGVFAAYSSMQHNLMDGQADTTYSADTGILKIHFAGNDRLTPNDSEISHPYFVTDTVIDIETYFDHYDSVAGLGWFSGGVFTLTFTFDGIGGYELSGMVDSLHMEDFFIYNPTMARSYTGGDFAVTTKNLPGSGSWLDSEGTGFSGITMASGADYTWWGWTEDFAGRVETMYTLYPVPEPATLLLLAGGSFVVICRWRG